MSNKSLAGFRGYGLIVSDLAECPAVITGFLGHRVVHSR